MVMYDVIEEHSHHLDRQLAHLDPDTESADDRAERSCRSFSCQKARSGRDPFGRTSRRQGQALGEAKIVQLHRKLARLGIAKGAEQQAAGAQASMRHPPLVHERQRRHAAPCDSPEGAAAECLRACCPG